MPNPTPKLPGARPRARIDRSQHKAAVPKEVRARSLRRMYCAPSRWTGDRRSAAVCTPPQRRREVHRQEPCSCPGDQESWPTTLALLRKHPAAPRMNEAAPRRLSQRVVETVQRPFALKKDGRHETLTKFTRLAFPSVYNPSPCDRTAGVRSIGRDRRCRARSAGRSVRYPAAGRDRGVASASRTAQSAPASSAAR